MSHFKFEVDDVPEQDWKVVMAIRKFISEIKQPITKADRIRAMSDEELAHFLSTRGCAFVNQSNCFEMSCEHCWEKWLKQPVEEQQ